MTSSALAKVCRETLGSPDHICQPCAKCPRDTYVASCGSKGSSAWHHTSLTRTWHRADPRDTYVASCGSKGHVRGTVRIQGQQCKLHARLRIPVAPKATRRRHLRALRNVSHGNFSHRERAQRIAIQGVSCMQSFVFVRPLLQKIFFSGTVAGRSKFNSPRGRGSSRY
jgi:hypothetical protein